MALADKLGDLRSPLRRVFLVLAMLSFGAGLHCGANSLSAGPFDEDASQGQDAGNSQSPDPKTGSADAGVSTASGSNADGVIVVHASASLPAFRLCFGTSDAAGKLVPLPDRDLMPESNVVGVEVGSAVRLQPLSKLGLTYSANAPHTVYAIPETSVRGTTATCRQLICSGGGQCLGSSGYHALGTLPQQAYTDKVHLLVVSDKPQVDEITLTAFDRAGPNEFAVQVAQLSPSLATAQIHMSFGDATNTTELTVPSAFGAVGPDSPQALFIDRSDPQIYASRQFNVSTGTVTFAQSLASIQALSAPQALPADFYSSQSNFVLLLLGNANDTTPDGGPKTPTTDPGKVLHLLAVPVAQQALDEDGGVDGGADAADAADASDAGVAD